MEHPKKNKFERLSKEGKQVLLNSVQVKTARVTKVISEEKISVETDTDSFILTINDHIAESQFKDLNEGDTIYVTICNINIDFQSHKCILLPIYPNDVESKYFMQARNKLLQFHLPDGHVNFSKTSSQSQYRFRMYPNKTSIFISMAPITIVGGASLYISYFTLQFLPPSVQLLLLAFSFLILAFAAGIPLLTDTKIRPIKTHPIDNST